MRSRGTWLAGMALVLLLTIGSLAGCSLAGEPSSAGDLLLRFASNPNNTNCVTSCSVDCVVSLAGYRVRTPITAELQSAGSSAHGKVTADLSAIDAGTQTYEVYVEVAGGSVAAYVRPEDRTSDTWDRTEADATFKLDIPLAVELLSDAKFMRVAYESDDQICYELTIPAKAIVESFLDRGKVEASFWEVDRQALLDAVKESKLHVCFDRDCLIRSISLDLGFTYVNKELVPQPLKVSLDLKSVSDGYGTVKPTETSVPEDVKSHSVLTDDPLYAKENAKKLVEFTS